MTTTTLPAARVERDMSFAERFWLKVDVPKFLGL